MNFTDLDSFHKVVKNDMRILVAEDDLTARTILTSILKKWGYDVIAVNDGLAAWELMQQPNSPLLIILDWIMPGMDGLEIIRRARTQLAEQPPYIILLTSKDEKGDILAGLESGANDYITKPFNNEELFARVRVGQRTMDLQTKLYKTQQILAHLATHDPLTGIFNRRAILEQLTKEISRAQRTTIDSGSDALSTQKLLSIGYFDVDKFKKINDDFGHQAGDEVLCGIIKLLISEMRPYDSIGRIGGDEFLIVSPGLTKNNQKNLFDRLTQTIAASPIQTTAGNMTLTISMGVATAEANTTTDQLLEKADAAMYQAKRNGGNQAAYT